MHNLRAVDVVVGIHSRLLTNLEYRLGERNPINIKSNRQRSNTKRVELGTSELSHALGRLAWFERAVPDNEDEFALPHKISIIPTARPGIRRPLNSHNPHPGSGRDTGNAGSDSPTGVIKRSNLSIPVVEAINKISIGRRNSRIKLRRRSEERSIRNTRGRPPHRKARIIAHGQQITNGVRAKRPPSVNILRIAAGDVANLLTLRRVGDVAWKSETSIGKVEISLRWSSREKTVIANYCNRCRSVVTSLADNISFSVDTDVLQEGQQRGGNTKPSSIRYGITTSVGKNAGLLKMIQRDHIKIRLKKGWGDVGGKTIIEQLGGKLGNVINNHIEEIAELRIGQ